MSIPWMGSIYELITKQCQVWVLILCIFVVVFLFTTLHIKARNRWIAFSEQERKKHRAELRNMQDRADQELNTIRSKTATEISAARKNAEKEIGEIQQQASSEILRIKQECESIIATEKQLSHEKLREERERIAAEKDALMARSEKDLLVQTVHSLASYATRLERIEASVYQLADCTVQQQGSTNVLKTNIETMCSAIDRISPQFDNVIIDLQKASKHTDSLQTEIGKLNTSLSSIIDWTEEFDNDAVIRTIEEYMDSAKEQFEQLRGYSTTASLTEIIEIIESIKSTISELQGYSSYVSLTSLSQSIDELKSSLESRSY